VVAVNSVVGGGDRLVGGRYRLMDPLGHGGMGVVWRATDELLHRAVAVKEVRLRFGLPEQAEQAAARTLREARAAAGLRHPGIVAVHDVVIEDGRPLIVMELVAGRSLAEVVRQEGPLPEERAASIGRQVLDALRAAHAAGILHRDVKPANILLDGDRAMLTDFGIAAVSGGTALTETNALVGSPEYLAPERVNGRPATEASDLWSVGVTLCVMSRGESPFQREDTQSTLAAVLAYDPPPQLGAGRLGPVIEGLLHKDPSRRLTSTAALELLSTPFGVSPPTDVPTRARRSRVRRRVLALLAVCVLVAGAAVTWMVLRSDNAISASTAPEAPPGFSRYEDPSGFSIAVPDGWPREADGQAVTWSGTTGPRDALWIHVTWQDGTKGTASRHLMDFERDQFSGEPVSEYRRIRMSGEDEDAVLECTYRVALRPVVYSHDVLRVVDTESGRRFTLALAVDSPDGAKARDALWEEHRARFEVVLDSFRVSD
jgi:Protein kinase domain